jgi:hypothetical protein
VLEPREAAADEALIDSPASASTRRFVAKRLAFSENTKSSGVSANQRSNDLAVIVL